MHLAPLLLAGAMLLGAPHAWSQVLEPQVKAAFLLRFLSFVEWPAPTLGPTEAPLVVAVLDADEVQAELEKMVANRKVNQRPVVVERLRDVRRPHRAHVVFVGRGSARQLQQLAAVPEVLLVAESEGAIEQGALINFVLREDRVRFEVAPDEAERRGLRIGARVLAVALNVKRGPVRP